MNRCYFVFLIRFPAHRWVSSGGILVCFEIPHRFFVTAASHFFWLLICLFVIIIIIHSIKVWLLDQLIVALFEVSVSLDREKEIVDRETSRQAHLSFDREQVWLLVPLIGCCFQAVKPFFQFDREQVWLLDRDRPIVGWFQVVKQLLLSIANKFDCWISLIGGWFQPVYRLFLSIANKFDCWIETDRLIVGFKWLSSCFFRLQTSLIVGSHWLVVGFNR